MVRIRSFCTWQDDARPRPSRSWNFGTDDTDFWSRRRTVKFAKDSVVRVRPRCRLRPRRENLDARIGLRPKLALTILFGNSSGRNLLEIVFRTFLYHKNFRSQRRSFGAGRSSRWRRHLLPWLRQGVGSILLRIDKPVQKLGITIWNAGSLADDQAFSLNPVTCIATPWKVYWDTLTC